MFERLDAVKTKYEELSKDFNPSVVKYIFIIKSYLLVSFELDLNISIFSTPASAKDSLNNSFISSILLI